MSKYISKVFYDDDQITLKLEEVDAHLMVHLVIKKALPSSIKKARIVFQEIKERAYWQGYEQIYTYTKDDRMLKFFGANKVISNVEYKGETYKVVQWDLN